MNPYLVAMGLLVLVMVVAWILTRRGGPRCPHCWHGTELIDMYCNANVYKCPACGREVID